MSHQEALKKFREIQKKHIADMKAKPIGTRVLVRFTEMAGEFGTLKKHGRKYAVVELDNGEMWKIPYWDITDKVEDPKALQEAEINRRLSRFFNGLFN